MKKICPRLYILLAALLLPVLACGLPSVAEPTTGQDYVAIAVARTMAALQPPATQPVMIVTVLATPEVPATQAVVASPTTGVPMISAKVNTNCRLGPSTAYDIVGYLTVGVKTEVVGKLAQGGWWYIMNPTKPGEKCWVWGDTTVVEGDTTALAVITPPPPPAANFTFSFNEYSICEGRKTISFYIKNTGGLTFESSVLTFTDVEDNNLLLWSSDNEPFVNGHCDGHENAISKLEPGETLLISSSLIATSGHHLDVELKLYTEEGLEGEYVKHSIRIMVP